MNKIEKIKAAVKECEPDDYTHHVLPTVKYALLLAERTGADKEIVEIASLLHDIGVKDDDCNHEKVSAERAESIMKELGYGSGGIEKVMACILTHRTSGEPRTKEAEIIRNADAMAHVAELPFLVKLGLEKEGNLTGAINWVKKKIDKADKKLTMKEAREIIKEKYDAVRLLLKDL